VLTGLKETKRLTASAVVIYLFKELIGDVSFGEAVGREI
jgi:predicted HTH domain antitoxin